MCRFDFLYNINITTATKVISVLFSNWVVAMNGSGTKMAQIYCKIVYGQETIVLHIIYLLINSVSGRKFQFAFMNQID